MPLWEVPRRVCESDCTSYAASGSLFLKTSIFLRKDAVVFLQQAEGFEEAVQTVSGMCGGEENGGGMKYLDIEGLGIRMFELQEYQLAMEALKKGEISKAMFQISQ